MNDFLYCTGARVREKRIANGLTIDQLAEYTNISSTTIKKIENGERNFRIETLKALAVILGVTTDYLLGFADNSNEGNINILLSELTTGEAEFFIEAVKLYIHKKRSNSIGY